jgi:hypothetical protein
MPQNGEEQNRQNSLLCSLVCAYPWSSARIRFGATLFGGGEPHIARLPETLMVRSMPYLQPPLSGGSAELANHVQRSRAPAFRFSYSFCPMLAAILALAERLPVTREKRRQTCYRGLVLEISRLSIRKHQRIQPRVVSSTPGGAAAHPMEGPERAKHMVLGRYLIPADYSGGV